MILLFLPRAEIVGTHDEARLYFHFLGACVCAHMHQCVHKAHVLWYPEVDVGFLSVFSQSYPECGAL